MNKQEFVASIPCEITELLETLQIRSEGYDVYTGGGCLADLYVEPTKYYSPKDIDVFFVPKQGATQLKLPTIPRSYINYDLGVDEIAADMRNRGVSTLRGLFVPNLTLTTDVQFIVYDTPMTQEELAKDMDCNVNQIMYSEGVVYWSEAFEQGHYYEIIRMLHTFDEKRMAKRLFRMEEKFGYGVDTEIDLDYYEYLKNDTPEGGGSMCDE